jgi:Suppressor of fused protein (SUFU)
MATRMPEPGRPTPRMKRLYHQYRERLGDPLDLWVFDPADLPAPPSTLTYKNVAVWPADAECEVTSVLTLGMSDRLMPGTDYRTELHMGIRAPLDKDQRLAMARFLANIAEYPFENARALDWWHVLLSPGRIPGFPGCPHLLFHPRLTDAGFDTVDDPEGQVKLLAVVPITPHERHLAVDHNKDALRDYWEKEGTDILADRSDVGRTA